MIDLDVAVEHGEKTILRVEVNILRVDTDSVYQVDADSADKIDRERARSRAHASSMHVYASAHARKTLKVLCGSGQQECLGRACRTRTRWACPEKAQGDARWFPSRSCGRRSRASAAGSAPPCCASCKCG